MSDTFDYLGTRDDADELLGEFGQTVTLLRSVNSGTPWEPSQSTVDYTTIAAILSLPRWYPPTVDGTDVLRTDRRGLVAAGPLAAEGVALQKFDKLLTSDGTIFQVLDSKPLAPAGVTVLYDCWLRV